MAAGWFGLEPRDGEEDSKLLLLLLDLSKDADFASKLLAVSFDRQLEHLTAETSHCQVRAGANALLSSLLCLPLVVSLTHIGC